MKDLWGSWSPCTGAVAERRCRLQPRASARASTRARCTTPIAITNPVADTVGGCRLRNNHDERHVSLAMQKAHRHHNVHAILIYESKLILWNTQLSRDCSLHVNVCHSLFKTQTVWTKPLDQSPNNHLDFFTRSSIVDLNFGPLLSVLEVVNLLP